MKRILFLDIETLPLDDKNVKMIDAYQKRHPGKPIHDSGLHGEFGCVFCIGYTVDIGTSAPAWQKAICATTDEASEAVMLREFWKIAAQCDLFVGHNILEFDLPFLIKRSIINGVAYQHVNLARYRRDPVFDTMKEWSCWKWMDNVSLDLLAKILGLKTSKARLDGSMVAEAYRQGKYEQICSYCMEDVRLVREIYYRMVSTNYRMASTTKGEG